MKYYIRLDDACEKLSIDNWKRIENLLDAFNIKPIVGIIPKCEDQNLNQYPYYNDFWEMVLRWKEKGWIFALHGYNHVYLSKSGGLNPVHNRSEFAGVELSLQKKKIVDGLKILQSHNIEPQVFYAPSHTFDENTLRALKETSHIRFISDTIANKRYYKDGFTFIPQQSGAVRKIILNIHPWPVSLRKSPRIPLSVWLPAKPLT